LYGGGLIIVTRTFHDEKEAHECIDKMRKDARYYDIHYVEEKNVNGGE
jgi:hypothetical protein